jgi:hypothetical protein
MVQTILNSGTSHFSSGVFTYTLVLNGVKQDVKKMVVIK